jgi:hypothetical protein
LIAASTPDTVPAIPCPVVKRLQPVLQRLWNVNSPLGQIWEAEVVQRSRFLLRWPSGPKRQQSYV